jgi:2-haloacid dehalogenase
MAMRTTIRRDFLKLVAAAAATFGASSAAAEGEEKRAESTTPARDLKKVKALAFDAYGTLFDVHSVIALGEELFPGKGNELSTTWRMKQLQYTWARSLMGRYEDFWKVTEDGLVFAAKSLNLNLDSDKRKRLMEAYLGLSAFADVSPGLKELSGAGYRLAILSNGTPRMLREAARSAGIDGQFARIISVDEIKVYKPSPRVYKLAPARFKMDPAAIGFVSSNSWDVAGAASFGLTTFWINRGNQPMDELGFPPARTVTKLTELLPALKSA